MPSLPLSGKRILIADDHAVVRLGFRLLIEGAGAIVVAEADSGETALSLYAAHQPDALLMDVSMPGIGGLGALERLVARSPKARVLMLSAHEDLQIPSRALKAGATGYLSKRAEPSELVRALAQVACGLRYIDPDLAPRLALAQLDGAANPTEVLTEKEFAVFLEIARGRSISDIAASHHLSPNTVGTHLYHIKQKLDASNTAQLALIAVRAGLIES